MKQNINPLISHLKYSLNVNAMAVYSMTRDIWQCSNSGNIYLANMNHIFVNRVNFQCLCLLTQYFI
jgi:hypothetical protein